MRAAITATGHYVPSQVYSNAHFASRLDTTDEWIRSRTGIVERRFATTGGTSDLVVPAAQRCLAQRYRPGGRRLRHRRHDARSPVPIDSGRRSAQARRGQRLGL
jgi:hypothetical protein